MTGGWDPQMMTVFLPEYYKRLFPFKTYFKWLCYNQSSHIFFGSVEHKAGIC